MKISQLMPNLLIFNKKLAGGNQSNGFSMHLDVYIARFAQNISLSSGIST
jgi:hypothetical protein